MRTTKNIVAILFLGLMITLMGSCKKEAGVDGKAMIKGTVTDVEGDAAEGANVFIAYGTKEKTEEYDDSFVTGSDGSYVFSCLVKGDYYLWATYEANGLDYSSSGYHVEINGNKNEATADLQVE